MGATSSLAVRSYSDIDSQLSDLELLLAVLQQSRSLAIGARIDLANALLRRFGCFGSVINASFEALMDVRGFRASIYKHFHLISCATIKLQQGTINEKRVLLGSKQEVVRYLRVALGYRSEEQARFLFLNIKNEIIVDYLHSQGTAAHAPICLPKVIKVALNVGASGVIVAHNHPSGDTTPSLGDISMTRSLVLACKPLNINVLDSFVITTDGYSSLRELRLM